MIALEVEPTTSAKFLTPACQPRRCRTVTGFRNPRSLFNQLTALLSNFIFVYGVSDNQHTKYLGEMLAYCPKAIVRTDRYGTIHTYAKQTGCYTLTTNVAGNKQIACDVTDVHLTKQL